jgi:hypothetical protein
MNPNWTKLTALVRVLLIIFASSFFGALVLPLAADGTLPITWTAWRPILMVAVSAGIVAEIIWLRTHVQQAAQAIGEATTDIGTPATVKTALAKIGIMSTVVLSLCCIDCTPAQVATIQKDTGEAIDLTNAVCSLAPDTPIAGTVVSVICTLVEGAEQLVSVVIGAIDTLERDGGMTTVSTSAIARVPIKQIRFSMSSSIAPKFLAAHTAKR